MIEDMFMTADGAVDSNGNKKEGHFTESNKGTAAAIMTLDLIEKDEKVLIITQSAPVLAKKLIYAATGINMWSETFDTEESKHLKSALEYLYNKRNNIAMVEEEHADFSWLSKIKNEKTFGYLIVDVPLEKEKIAKLKELGISLVITAGE